MGRIIKDGIMYAGSVTNAKSIRYDNSDSNLDATNIKDAIDELASGDTGAITLTEEEYDALSEEEQNTGTYYIIDDDDGMFSEAELIVYYNDKSGLASENVQDAIDEVVKENNELKDALNEHKSAKNPHGMTATDVGALPDTGGNYKGAIGVTNFINILHNGVKKGSVANYGSGETIIEVTNSDNTFRRYLSILDNEYQPDMSQALNFVETDGNSWNIKRIYGEHNKPMAEDVGALPLTGGTMSGGIINLNSGWARLYGSGYNSNISHTDAQGNITNNRIELGVMYPNQNNGAYDITSSAFLSKYENGVNVALYKIYGEHNITTGTSPLIAGTSTLATGCIYEQYE